MGSRSHKLIRRSKIFGDHGVQRRVGEPPFWSHDRSQADSTVSRVLLTDSRGSSTSTGVATAVIDLKAPGTAIFQPHAGRAMVRGIEGHEMHAGRASANHPH
jgi:hypothetical protein